MTLCLTLPLILAACNKVVLIKNFGIGVALFFYFADKHGGKDMAIFEYMHIAYITTIDIYINPLLKISQLWPQPAEKDKTLTKILDVKSKMAKLG